MTTGGLSQPSGIAFDQSGQAYVVNRGNFNICEYSPSGESVATPIYSPTLGSSVAIAVDYSGWAYTPTNAPDVPGIGGLVSGQLGRGISSRIMPQVLESIASLSVALDSYIEHSDDYILRHIKLRQLKLRVASQYQRKAAEITAWPTTA